METAEEKKQTNIQTQYSGQKPEHPSNAQDQRSMFDRRVYMKHNKS